MVTVVVGRVDDGGRGELGGFGVVPAVGTNGVVDLVGVDTVANVTNKTFQ